MKRAGSSNEANIFICFSTMGFCILFASWFFCFKKWSIKAEVGNFYTAVSGK